MPLNVGVHHVVDRTEVGRDRADLLGDAGEKVEVGHVGARPGGRNEVKHLRLRGLAVAVDATDALFESRRIERNVEVHQTVAVRLQVDALARGVGGHQHPDRLDRRVCAELLAGAFALLGRG